jgi:putative membrane protein
MKIIIQKIIVLLSIFVMAKLLYTNELSLLIHPRYFWLIYSSIAVLTVTLIFNRETHSHLKNYFAQAMLLLAMTMGLIIDLKPLSSAGQQQTSYENLSDTNQIIRSKYATSFQLNTAGMSLDELVSLISIDPEPTKYIDKPVVVSGFYFETADGSPMIARHVISCCAADARLIGLWLKEPLDLQLDTWIEVQGTLDLIENDGFRGVAINTTEFDLIDIPKNPYVVN